MAPNDQKWPDCLKNDWNWLIWCCHSSYRPILSTSANFIQQWGWTGQIGGYIFSKNELLSWPILGQFSHLFWPFWPKLLKNVPNLTISLQKSRKKLEKIGKCPKTYPKPKMVPKMGEDGQIWLKCITGDLIMIRDKNNIFERVKNFHADLTWNYPIASFSEWDVAFILYS